MGQRTKRVMELVTLAAIVMVMMNFWLPGGKPNRSRESEISELAAILNQALWDKYGPGSRQGYLDLFGTLDLATPGHGSRRPYPLLASPEPTPPPAWFAALESARMVSYPGGMVGVPEAPAWFQELLAEVDLLSASVERVLGKGPLVTAPGEVDFASPTRRLPDFIVFQRMAKSLRLPATRDWVNGDREQAVSQLSRILRMGDALEPGPEWIAQLMRPAAYGIGLYGFSMFVWADPAPRDSDLVLQTLEAIHSENWKVPPHAGRLLWDYPMLYEYFPPDFIPTVRLLQSAGSPSPDKVTQAVLRQNHIVPDHPLSTWEIASRMENWTTLPAMRRRARRISAAYFETDPLLSATAAQRCPRLAYVASRAREAGDLTVSRTEQRFANSRNWLETLQGAFRARSWRDQHQRWPDVEEFLALVPKDASLEWHVLTDPDLLVDSFLTMHSDGASPDPPVYHHRGRDPQDPSLLYFPLPDDPADYLHGVVNEGVTPTQEEFVRWMMGILEAQPLVESVTVTQVPRRDTPPQPGTYQPGVPPGMMPYAFGQSPPAMMIPSRSGPPAGPYYPPGTPYYGAPHLAPHPHYEPPAPSYSLVTAHLRFPKKSYWVTHPGPDGRHDGPTLSYDPTNGTASRGDIVQLAGWE